MSGIDKIKFWKSVEWLRPFVGAGIGYVPVHKIKRVVGFRVSLDKQIKTAAQTIKYTNSNKSEFMITINTHDHKLINLGGKKFKKKDHKEYILSYVLDSLAHELAHLKHWNHTPEHLELQCKILARMARVAKKLGVTDLSVSVSKYKHLVKGVKNGK